MLEKERLKISIITVCLNAASTLEQTILSVIGQTYPEIEFIIIDGRSTDGTLDIISKYQDKLAYWISEPDTGIYQAMNKGIKAATGDYIYFLGADDSLFNSSIIETVCGSLVKTCPEVLCGSIYIVDDVFATGMQRKTGMALTEDEVFSGCMAPHQGMFVRADVMERYLYDEKYKIAGDYDLFVKLNKKGHHIQYIDEIIAFYSNGGVGASRNMPRVYECFNIIKNSLPEKYVDRYERKEGKGERFRIHLDRLIRKVLNALGLIRYYRLYYGWEDHRCGNEKCRWCMKGK